MDYGTEFMFGNENDAPSVVPGMLTLLQLDPYLKQYRKEIERRYITWALRKSCTCMHYACLSTLCNRAAALQSSCGNTA